MAEKDLGDIKEIVRAALTHDENAMAGDAEIERIVDMGINELSHQIHGTVSAETLAQGADGYYALDKATIRVLRVEHAGKRVSLINMNDVLELE